MARYHVVYENGTPVKHGNCPGTPARVFGCLATAVRFIERERRASIRYGYRPATMAVVRIDKNENE